jgi:hypothetical protein
MLFPVSNYFANPVSGLEVDSTVLSVMIHHLTAEGGYLNGTVKLIKLNK